MKGDGSVVSRFACGSFGVGLKVGRFFFVFRSRSFWFWKGWCGVLFAVSLRFLKCFEGVLVCCFWLVGLFCLFLLRLSFWEGVSCLRKWLSKPANNLRSGRSEILDHSTLKVLVAWNYPRSWEIAKTLKLAQAYVKPKIIFLSNSTHPRPSPSWSPCTHPKTINSPNPPNNIHQKPPKIHCKHQNTKQDTKPKANQVKASHTNTSPQPCLKQTNSTKPTGSVALRRPSEVGALVV